MSEHLDLDALADVLAGVDDGSGHLAGCQGCQGRLAQLEHALPAVSASLATLPEPSEPAELAERLDRVLQAERRPAAATVVPLASRRRARLMPLLGAVAAAAVVAVGAVVAVSQQGGSSASDDGTTYALSSTGTDYAKDGKALVAALPELLEGGAPGTAPEVQMLAPPDAATPGPTDNATTRSSDTAAASGDPFDTLRTDAGLAACLVALTDPEDPEAGVPLALDYASFEGQPALVVVLPTPSGDKVDVFVVGTGCSQSDAQLLFFTRLSKP